MGSDSELGNGLTVTLWPGAGARSDWYYHKKSANKLFGNQTTSGPAWWGDYYRSWSELSAWQIVKVYPEFMTRQIQYFSFLRAEPELVPGGGGEGAGGGDRPGAQNLNLIRNTLKYIVINPGRFNLPTNIPCNLVHFIFPSPVTLFVCLFVPSSCLPPRLCRISPDHLHLPDLNTQTLKWLQGPAGEEEEWPSLSRRLPGHGSLGGPHEGVSCVSWCHGVMALLSAHVECRSNSWTASCQCPQSGPTPGQSPSDSRLRLRPRVHGSYTLSVVTPVFIAATSHSPGQSQVHIITVVTRGNKESNCDNKIRPR